MVLVVVMESYLRLAISAVSKRGEAAGEQVFVRLAVLEDEVTNVVRGVRFENFILSQFLIFAQTYGNIRRCRTVDGAQLLSVQRIYIFCLAVVAELYERRVVPKVILYLHDFHPAYNKFSNFSIPTINAAIALIQPLIYIYSPPPPG